MPGKLTLTTCCAMVLGVCAGLFLLGYQEVNFFLRGVTSEATVTEVQLKVVGVAPGGEGPGGPIYEQRIAYRFQDKDGGEHHGEETWTSMTPLPVEPGNKT